ncbi:MAG: hypothetical protein OXE79_07915 [Acidimicrobiaceae bacterium]|nr:hypothetical protein [Acidimicrobiaceae bacterium]MCY4175776.1 hypothetical protein [Acidimicrobiaceae bacterium]MCY4280851.1 hypothetical protein [Acidimicrobiaceae bacterium]MCY4293864.1 hypothetical protein [Acidimicrobiaceae bacterium]
MLNRSGTVPPDSSPSLRARILSFTAVILAGVCGGLTGFAVMDVGCRGDCEITAGFVGLASAVGAAVGTGIVVVLALRASAEWRAQQPQPEPQQPHGPVG